MSQGKQNSKILAIRNTQRKIRRDGAYATWRNRPRCGSLTVADSKEYTFAALKTAQLQRDSGETDDEESLFILAYCFAGMADERSGHDAEMQRIEFAIGEAALVQSRTEPSRGPDDSENKDLAHLYAAWEVRKHQIEGEIMREWGEDELARLYETDPLEFSCRYQRGRARTHAPLSSEA